MPKTPLNLNLFLVLGAIITALFATVYVTIQQNYRQSANDPQVQISESVASMLSQGEDLAPYLPAQPADLSRSLAVFIIVYNDNAEPTLSTAKLDEVTPNLPQGVLEHAKNNGQNRVTWQPKEGVRIATVITKYNGGYVLAGRSLREVESRIDLMTKKIIFAWLATLAIAFLGSWFLIPKNKSR